MSIVNDLIGLMLQMEDAEDAEIVRAFAKRFGMDDDDIGYITGYLTRKQGMEARELLGVRHPIFDDQDYGPEDLLKLGMLTAHYLTQGNELPAASAQARSDLKHGIADEVLEDLTDVSPYFQADPRSQHPDDTFAFEVTWAAPNGERRFMEYAAKDAADAVRGVIASDSFILATPGGKMFFSVQEAGSNHVETIEAGVTDSGLTTFTRRTPADPLDDGLAPKAYDITWLGDSGSEHIARVEQARTPVEAIRTLIDREATTPSAILPAGRRLVPPDGGKRFLSVREQGTNRVTAHAVETHDPHSVRII